MSVPASPEYAVRDTPDIVIESMNISMSTPIPYEAPSVWEKEKVPVSDTVDHTSPEHETSDTIHLSVDDAEEIGWEASPEEVAVWQESVENLPEEDLGTLPIIEPFIEPSDPVIAEPFADTYVETPVITPTTPRSIQLTITLPSVEW